MKLESDPVTEDEWLIRLVWEDRVTDRAPIISPSSFEPRNSETDGISFFRRSCLDDPTETLSNFDEGKQSRYAIVQVPVWLLHQLELDVAIKPIDKIPGHVVIPQLNINDYKANKPKFTPIKLRLAQVASENIVRLPTGKSS